MLRLDPNKKRKPDEHDLLFLKSNLSSPKTIKFLPVKSYGDSLTENDRNGLDLSGAMNDQDIEVINAK